MQRLFTTFANSWPGLGLFLQRLVIAAWLFYNGFASLGGSLAIGLLALQMASAVLGLFILVGLWTPPAGFLLAIFEVWIAFVEGANVWMSLVLAVLGITLAMIGPGAWSLDARIFGRKRIAN